MLDNVPPSGNSVCVVIPMYNCADCIEQTLASLAGQTRLPDHVIVIDDGSTDDGPQRVEDFPAPFRLTLLHQANAGPASARNTGVSYARETFVAFLDADDQWLPPKLEKQLALYDQLSRQGRSVGLIDCYVRNEYNDGTSQVEDRCKSGWHFDDFIYANVLNGASGVLLKRDVINEIGGFDTSLRYAEDRLLWTRIAEHREIHTVAQVLVRRMVNSGNITAQPTRYYSHKLRFIDLYLARYGERLSKQQRIDFVLGNLAEFLRAFSRAGEYTLVIGVYRRMFEYSWQALIFSRGKPTLRYLYARLKTLRNAAESTTAH